MAVLLLAKTPDQAPSHSRPGASLEGFAVGRALTVPPAPAAELEVPGLLRRFAQILLLGLGLALPFEVVLFSIRSLTITLPELFLYLLIAVWFGALLKPEHFRPGGFMRPRLALVRLARDPVALAVTVWMTVTLFSALAAGTHRLPAVKFSLRTLSGVLLYFVARDLAGPSPIARRLVTAVVAGALLSAALTFLEALKPEWSSWWRLFRPQEFNASGMRRASGSFAFPNIGAMYWEATLPLLLLLFISIRQPPKPAYPTMAELGAMIVTAVILVHAIVASATRASIFGTAFIASLLLLCCLGVRIYRRHWPIPSVARFAGTVLVAEALLATAAIWQQGSASVIAQRLLWWREQDWYKARYMIEAKEPLKLTAGEIREVVVRVQNVGIATWHRAGVQNVQLGYHWDSGTSKGGSRGQLEGQRALLPGDLAPGATATVAVLVEAPARPGEYWLRWDMVEDGATWFSGRGAPTGNQVVSVEPSSRPMVGSVRSASSAEGVPLPTRTELWTAALRLWRLNPILGVGPDNFRHRYSEAVHPAGGGTFTDERMHANNLYFEVLADLGLAGMAALVLLIYALARAALGASARADPLILLPLLAALTFFVHGTVDYFFEFTPTFGLWWLLMALAGRGSPEPAR
jgi:hypothetical protein